MAATQQQNLPLRKAKKKCKKCPLCRCSFSRVVQFRCAPRRVVQSRYPDTRVPPIQVSSSRVPPLPGLPQESAIFYVFFSRVLYYRFPPAECLLPGPTFQLPFFRTRPTESQPGSAWSISIKGIFSDAGGSQQPSTKVQCAHALGELGVHQDKVPSNSLNILVFFEHPNKQYSI